MYLFMYFVFILYCACVSVYDYYMNNLLPVVRDIIACIILTNSYIARKIAKGYTYGCVFSIKEYLASEFTYII